MTWPISAELERRLLERARATGRERLDVLEEVVRAGFSELEAQSGRASAPEAIAHRWLNAILMEAAATVAPMALGTKWERSYRWLGQRPEVERKQVGELLRGRLRRGETRARYITPAHLVSYWPQYLAGEPPCATRPESSRAPADVARMEAELEAEAADNPTWLDTGADRSK